MKSDKRKILIAIPFILILVAVIVFELFLLFGYQWEIPKNPSLWFDEPTTAPTETLPQDQDSDTPKDYGDYMDSATQLLEYTDPETEYTMEYYLYVPELATEEMPLVVYLHGVGEVGSARLVYNNPLIHNLHLEYEDFFPFIVLAPSTKANSWIKGKIPATLKGMIDSVVDEYQIDPDRIIITGYSMGATGMHHMVSEYGDYFAGAVSVSAPNPENFDPETFLDVPFMSYAGSKEPQCVLGMERLVEKINDLGGTAQHITLENYVHREAPYGAFTMDLFVWMQELS